MHDMLEMLWYLKCNSNIFYPNFSAIAKKENISWEANQGDWEFCTLHDGSSYVILDPENRTLW